MKTFLITIAIFVSAIGGLQAQYVLQTLDQRWGNLGLIAIVDVGKVSEVSTPQGLVLQSATAKIERLIYRRFPPFPESSTDEVTLYSFLPNGFEVACPSPITLKPGRAFIMVQQRGINRFFPSDPWEFQDLEKETILWPTTSGIKRRPLNDVISEIEAYAASHKDDKR